MRGGLRCRRLGAGVVRARRASFDRRGRGGGRAGCARELLRYRRRLVALEDLRSAGDLGPAPGRAGDALLLGRARRQAGAAHPGVGRRERCRLVAEQVLGRPVGHAGNDRALGRRRLPRGRGRRRGRPRRRAGGERVTNRTGASRRAAFAGRAAHAVRPRPRPAAVRSRASGAHGGRAGAARAARSAPPGRRSGRDPSAVRRPSIKSLRVRSARGRPARRPRG